MGDINADRRNTNVDSFYRLYNSKHLIKVSTYCKNPDNPLTIDLMLTKMHRSFQNSCVIETGIETVI